MSNPASDSLPPPLIHVGYPKALSSWMQRLLFRPECGFFTVMEQITVQLQVIDPPPFDFDVHAARATAERTWRDAQCPAGTVPIVTAEALIGQTYCGGYNAKMNADRLHALFPEARVLMIVREQKSMLRSLYKTFITWGMPHTLERLLSPVEPGLSPQFNADFLRYDRAVEYYQKLFGRDHVLVLPYELFQQDGKAFVSRILQFCGATMPEQVLNTLPLKRRINQGQTLVNLLWQRWLNLLFLSTPFNYAGLFRPTAANWQKRVARSKRNPFPRFMDHWFEAGFRHKVAQWATGRFTESNRRLEELTGLELGQYGYDR